jgi:hypothetical protein
MSNPLDYLAPGAVILKDHPSLTPSLVPSNIPTPFGIIFDHGMPSSATPPSKSAVYGSNGSQAVHWVLTQIAEEIVLVLILSAMAARGGSAGKIATAIMVGVAVLWALANLGNV